MDANNIPSGSMIPSLKIGDYLFVNKMRYSLRVPFWGKELWHIDDPKRGDIVTFLPPTGERKHYVKRVMAMPGDRIRLQEVSACSLNPPGQRGLLSSKERNYDCNKLSNRARQEPIITIIHYRPKDQGAWQHTSIEELPQEQLKQEGITIPQPYPPVLYRETIGGKSHLILESGLINEAVELCPKIYGSGCVIPPKHYFMMGDNRDYSKDSRIIGFIKRKHIYGKVIVIYFSINWRDDACAAYWSHFGHKIQNLTDDKIQGAIISDYIVGLPLTDFPPKQQHNFCREYDSYRYSATMEREGVHNFLGTYLYHTIRYRIPRMSVRWNRSGLLLH